MADGPAVGLAMMDGLADEGALASYPYLHAARADLLRRLGRRSEAAAAYRHALALTANRPERSFLERRLREVDQEEQAASGPSAGPGAWAGEGPGARPQPAVRPDPDRAWLPRPCGAR